MLTKKCFATLILVITIQFSQTYGAPSSNNLPEADILQQEEDQNSRMADSTSLDEQKEFDLERKEETEIPPISESSSSYVEKIEETPSFGANENPMMNQDKNHETTTQAPTLPESEITGSTNALYGLPTQTLSREAELELLKKIPEFQTVMRSIEELPAEIYYDIKIFLDNIVSRMPIQNLVALHFRNAQTMMQLFERVIKVASAENDEDHKLRQNLINRVHKVAPELKYEMQFTNNFINHAKKILSNNETPTNEMKNNPVEQNNPISSQQQLVGEDNSQDELLEQEQPSADRL